MNKFNWSNYVGDHMDEPLRVKILTGSNTLEANFEFLFKLKGANFYSVHCSDGENYSEDDCKPLIKSPEDLTDEEWLFVFGENKDSYHINRVENSVVVCFNGFKASEWSNEFDFNQNVFEHSDQQLLNRLYSLHVSLHYKELIEKEVALRK